MSIVGTRPPTLDEWNKYELHHRARLAIKPGIPDYPELHPAKTHIRCWRERINFVHCNTAIGADGKKKDRQLMNVDELAKCSPSGEKTNIILAHNSFEDMDARIQNRMKRMQ